MSLCKLYLENSIDTLAAIENFNVSYEGIIEDFFRKLHEWYTKAKNFILKMVDKLIYNINIIRNKLSGRFIAPLQEIYKKLMRADDIRKSNINDKLKNKSIEAYEVNSTAIANYEKFVVAAVKDIDEATKSITVDGMLRTLYFPKKNITESFMEETVNELSHKLNVIDILGNTTLNEYKSKGNLILSDREVLIPGSKYKFKSYKIEKNNNIFTIIYKIKTYDDCVTFVKNSLNGLQPILSDKGNLNTIQNSISKTYEAVKVNAGYDDIPEELKNSEAFNNYKRITYAVTEFSKEVALFKYELIKDVQNIYTSIGTRSLPAVMALSTLI